MLTRNRISSLLNYKYIYSLVAVCLVWSLPATDAAELRLARYFNDGMVMQREKPALVRGFAAPGKNTLAVFLSSNRGHLHDFDFGIEVSR